MKILPVYKANVTTGTYTMVVPLWLTFSNTSFARQKAQMAANGDGYGVLNMLVTQDQNFSCSLECFSIL